MNFASVVASPFPCSLADGWWNWQFVELVRSDGFPWSFWMTSATSRPWQNALHISVMAVLFELLLNRTPLSAVRRVCRRKYFLMRRLLLLGHFR